MRKSIYIIFHLHSSSFFIAYYNLTAIMSRNSKGTVEEKARAAHRNNINIQINFNMKDKNQPFAGKKIDNYVEVDHKNNSKTDSYSRTIQDNKKIKKKQSDASQKQQKQKNFDTPMKHRYIELNKLVKNRDPKTPEKIQVSRKEERSKSHNGKLIKRKNAKSMQNLKAGIRYTKNKGYSPQSSGEKSRSRSRSSKNIGKSNDPSTKNLHVFSNSGIKNKVSATKSNQGRERMTSATSKRTINQEDHEKIRKYMQDKKKKQKQENQRKNKDSKSRREKIQLQLKKVELERRANASKPVNISHKLLDEQRQRFPIYCSESEDEFHESVDYEKQNKEASDLLHSSPHREDPMESISIEKFKKYQMGSSSSKKKSHKKKRQGLVYRYLNGTITPKHLEILSTSIMDIQRCWRGYVVRKEFASKLADESTKYRYIKNKMESKRDIIWNDQEDNSIMNVDRDSTIRIYDSGSSSLHLGHFNSNPQSEGQYTDRGISDEKNKTDRFKKLQIHLNDSAQEYSGSKERSQRQTFENSKMLRQIEELRKMLDQQNQKYNSLEVQYINLKKSRNLGSKEIKELKVEGQDLIKSTEIIQFRMPQKIASPSNQLSIQQYSEQPLKPADFKQKKLTIDPSGNFDVKNFKQSFQAFDCSSPSNAKIEEQLKQLRNKKVKNLFEKKELKLQLSYQKKKTMFEEQYNNRRVSPRTFNMKKKQLEENLHYEKAEIKQKIQEAKMVLGYFDDISSEESQKKQQRPTEESQKLFEHRQPNFKKDKNVQDSCTNTSPIQIKKIVFEPNPQVAERNEDIYPIQQVPQNNSYTSQDDRYYKQYWTDDIGEVHKHALQITKKIDEAMKIQSSQSSGNKEDLAKQESSNSSGIHQEGYFSYDSSKDPLKRLQQKLQLGHHRSKSSEIQINLDLLKESYEGQMDESKDFPSEAERKARQIFNKIDVYDDIQCKSEDMENSHDNICNLLNQRPLSAKSGEPQQKSNLYISEAEFNSKKKKEQQLSKSSSFEKSNKSLNNSSVINAKGFITNLTFIKQFCISICEFIRNSDQWKPVFVDKLSQPTRYNLNELLRSYRITVGGEVKNNYNTFQDEYIYPYFKTITQKSPAISHELFHQFIKVYEEDRTSNLVPGDNIMNAKTKQLRQFFLVGIIDTLNESLEFQKPGSIYGESIPWLNHDKHLKNHKNITLKCANTEKHFFSGSDSQEQSDQERRLDQIFGTSIAKLIQWGSCLCGFIADPMPMEMGDSQIANLSDQQLTSIRENRVGLMLQKWLLEQQEQMTNSTSEYTEVLLCLTEKIYETLVFQCIEEVQELVISQ